jgi:hypothetical protein
MLLITGITAFITPFLASSVNIALPTINSEFTVTDQGQMLSLGIANLIFTVFMGHTEIPKTCPYDTLMHSIQVAFIVMAVLCVIGVILSLARGNLRKTPVLPIAP